MERVCEHGDSGVLEDEQILPNADENMNYVTLATMRAVMTAVWLPGLLWT